MAQKKWQKVKDIFVDVMQQKPEVRQEFLETVCKGNREIKSEVESLLSSYDSAESFMETPAAIDFRKTPYDKTPQLIKGQTLGHYEVIEQIGTGGMGEVYLANDTKLDRKVAIKILFEKFSQDESNLQRFTQEAKAASGLNHPNILVIHEIGETENAQYIVSEHIEGKTLREFTKKKSLKLSQVLDFSIQIAGALSAAHKANLVHRDIKPENIMVRPDGFVKILDFGLAKLVEQKNLSVGSVEDKTLKQNQTAKGVIMGTVNYMSPEQAKGKKVDERTDIFSFGVVLYEMITGHNPFASETTNETIAAILKSDPKPLNFYVPNISPKLEQIVSKILRKNSKKRYQNIKDLLIDLQELKQELEFEAKLEKSVQPNLVRFNENEGEKTAIIREQDSVEQNATTVGQNISSAEYITTGIRKHKYTTLAVLATIVITFATLSYFTYFAPASPITSVAVLPLENKSGDENLKYLSDGLSEDLINRLSHLPQLKVISRQSSFQFSSKNANFREIGNKLDVQAVVAGKILKVGDKLTILVEMVDTSDNKQIWGERYVKTVDDVLEIQNEIARIVSEKLHLQLTGQQKQEVSKVGTDNDEAYQLYLNGKIILSEKGMVDGADKAIEYYEKSIELDPNFALPYAEIASIYLLLTWDSFMDPKEAIPKAKTLVQKALELNPNLAEAHFVLGSIKRREWDFDGAKIEMEKAIELSPNNAKFRQSYARFLSHIGEHEKAYSEIKKAQMLAPLDTKLIETEGFILIEARRFKEAIEKLKNNIELKPNAVASWYGFGYALVGTGDYKKAIEAYEKVIELSNNPYAIGSIHIYLGAAYALDGNREKAVEILKKLEEKDRTKDGYISYTEFAIIYGALGDKDKAFQMLEKAYEREDFQLTTLYADLGFEPLRDDPRFTDLARRVSLPQAK